MKKMFSKNCQQIKRRFFSLRISLKLLGESIHKLTDKEVEEYHKT